MPNKEAEAIRELAAKVLGWPEEDVDKISHRMIQVIIRKRPDINERGSDAWTLNRAIDWGHHPDNPHPVWLDDPVKKLDLPKAEMIPSDYFPNKGGT